MARPVTGYRLKDGSRVPGVTTITGRFKESGGLLHWAWQCGIDGKDFRKERDSASSAGHLAHELIEADILGREPFLATNDNQMLSLATKGLEGFREWRRGSSVKIISTESPLVSERHKFGGTPDGIGELSSGELILLDWKTSNRIYQDYLIQVAAYCGLWEEANPERPISAIHVLRLGKEHGDFHHSSWPRSVLELGWRSFLLMRELYELDKQLKRAAGV